VMAVEILALPDAAMASPIPMDLLVPHVDVSLLVSIANLPRILAPRSTEDGGAEFNFKEGVV
jgi:hypothetical protein